MEKPEVIFDAPIPGMSLTHELGARPWQTPPVYATLEQAVDYYIERMSTEEFASQLVDVLEMGIPVTTIVDTMHTAGVMEGLHTVDIGLLISPILMEFIMLIADSQNIDYVTGMEDTEGPSQAAVNKAIGKFRSEIRDTKEESDKDEVEETEIEEPKQSGLMARRA